MYQSGGTSSAFGVSILTGLHDRGVISDVQFEREKVATHPWRSQ
jgi:hypothetical protein